MAKGQPPNRKYTTSNRRKNLKRAIQNPRVVESGTAGYAAVRLAQAGVKAAKKAVREQNKSASTYRSVDPKRSEAAKKAAATRKRNIEAAAKAEGRSIGRKQGAASGLLVGSAVSGTGSLASGSKPSKKSKKTSEPPNRKYTASNRAKAAKRKKK